MKELIKKLTMTATLVVLGAGSALAQCIATDDGSGVQTQTLFAGQTIDAGTVSVEVAGDELVVTYNTNTIDGWELVEAHLWVGNDTANMPQTRKGNPKVGNFPYKSGDITGADSYTFTLPLTALGFSCPADDANYYVAAHAALRRDNGGGSYQTETGWADGDRFVEKGNWGTYFTITLTCDCGNGGGGGDTCETAFAYGGNDASCFLDIDEDDDDNGDFSRWGWSNGPLGEGTYSFDIYAGAGQCVLNKGTLVGTLMVDYDGSTAIVTYNTTGSFTMEEVHVYVGNSILALDVNDQFTVAPGQYPNIHEDLGSSITDTVTVTGLSGDIYVVAHAVVCGDY